MEFDEIQVDDCSIGFTYGEPRIVTLSATFRRYKLIDGVREYDPQGPLIIEEQDFSGFAAARATEGNLIYAAAMEFVEAALKSIFSERY